MKIARFPFIIAFIAVSLASRSQSYTFSQLSYTYNSFPSSCLSGDFNNDGKKDLVVQEQNAVTAYLQVPGNSFNLVSSPFTMGPDLYCAADFNNDGNIDIIGNSGFYAGNGAGSFSVATTNQSFSSHATLAADFNKDGKQDAASLNGGATSTLNVFTGMGNGNFNAPTSYTFAGDAPNIGGYPNLMSATKIKSGDLNNDTNPDLVVTTAVPSGTSSVSSLHILSGNGAGGFTVVNTYTFGFDIYSLQVNDMNADGNLDISFASPNNVITLAGNGSGAFNPYSNITLKSECISTGDLNSDGKPEVLNFYRDPNGFICIHPNTVSFIDNSGTGLTLNSGTMTVNVFSGGFSPLIVEDFNSDGKLDLAVNTYSCTPYLHIYFNTTSITGVPENEGSSQVVVFPNPSNGKIRVKKNSNEQAELQIFNIQGVQVYQDLIEAESAVDTKLSRGFYLYTLKSKNTLIHSGKLIIE